MNFWFKKEILRQLIGQNNGKKNSLIKKLEDLTIKTRIQLIECLLSNNYKIYLLSIIKHQLIVDIKSNHLVKKNNL
jgi:hypothetical protein